ncbi:UNVERIFIED_CONTAM: ABC transporter ATP-binding protein [Streptococcus canis]|uniref:ABC transporter ATP-binding protein n=1 Tax=Streptococcus canis TaxID=1329 RepID=UPI000B8B02EC|nr:ABC transporter ATP-binding protein [Streptococcus canis]QJD12066.1 ABC transporter ATP-binding protein [Streptococcus canis]VTR79722.1 ATPase and permease component [Streptococcus canis]GFG47290.1 ABC transporter ATP-binding protein [Streptococcus canis]GMX35788.1 ABC transporter ATP-binding protein [Streptococcus canis]GMX39283.1 ABC transporter ATP-binding protein [Streptococcus canis]
MLSLMSRYIKQKKWVYIMIALMLFIYDASLIIPTKVIQSLIDAMSKQHLTQSSLVAHVFILLGATLLSYATGYLWHLKLFQEAVHFKFDLQQGAFRKLVFMRTPFYDKFRSGDMMTRFSTDVEALMDFIGYGLMIILYAGGMIAFIIPTMFLISWQMTLIGMVPIVIMMVMTYFITKKQEVLVEEAREAISNLSDEVLETVEGIRVMRAYSKKDYMDTQFGQKTQALADRWNRIASYRGLYFPVYSVMIVVSTLMILVVGLQFISKGEVSLGQVIALQLYLVSLVEPFAMLSDFILVYQTGHTSFNKINELIETSDDMEEDGQLALPSYHQIALKDYSFSYANSNKPSLSAINLVLNKGETLGIVGKTGSGKTTLVRQFLRQYPVGQGQFLINGQHVLDYQRRSLEEHIGYVPQEHVLFSKTVFENIAMGKKDASLEEILSAIATASFTEDLKGLSKGLETKIGERGLSISGGQKQRISIARAFLSEPDLLILDDSLSAVDAKTETEIINHIQEERQGKTTIIVSHRLSAIQHADWVIVMDQGSIIEEGKPDDLLAQKGWYYEQYQRQQAQED